MKKQLTIILTEKLDGEVLIKIEESPGGESATYSAIGQNELDDIEEDVINQIADFFRAISE